MQVVHFSALHVCMSTYLHVVSKLHIMSCTLHILLVHTICLLDELKLRSDLEHWGAKGKNPA
jgi:hypothetical protein